MDIVNQDKLIVILDSVLRKGGIINCHIDSFNRFNSFGLVQIMTKIFSMEYPISNGPDTVEQDTTIEKYTVEVIIDNIEITPPTTYNYDSQKPQILMPNEALLKDLTYCSPMYIDATIIAKAYHVNGTTSVKKEEIKHFLIAKMPIMVKSRMCNTYGKSKEALIRLKEDPSDFGGYFIIKGNQYIINNLESMKHNEPREFISEGYKNVSAWSDIISKPGDGFENSSNLIIKLLNNNSIIINLNIHKGSFKDLDIPFFMFFRAYGIDSNKKIIEYITYSLDQGNPIVRQMTDILSKAFSSKYNDFEKYKNMTSQTDVLEVLCRYTSQYDKYDNMRSKESIVTKETITKEELNVRKYAMNAMMNILDNDLLPHIGMNKEDWPKKVKYLGYLIHRLLLVHLGVLPPFDRDSYKNKRINDSGVSYSRIYKTQFNFAVVQKLKRQFMKDFKSTSFSDIHLQSSFKNAIKPEEFEKLLVTAITSGDKTLTVAKMTITNRLSSQQLQPKNKLNILTALKNIETPNKNDSSKSSERAITLRQFHSTGVGYICGVTSADTGTKVGMSKQMGISTNISEASSSEVLKFKIYDDPLLISLDASFQNYAIYQRNLTKVFVNGDWMGCVEDFTMFLNKYRNMRRTGQIHYLTTVAHDIRANEIHLWVDSGRLTRPLLIVYNNTEDPEYTHDTYKQWIKLTNEMIERIEQNKMDIDDLINEGVIEFITPEEHDNCYIAYELDHFKKHLTNPLERFTHVDIPQALLGLVALTSVFANHNQAARVVFQTNQVKQTNSWPLKNWQHTAHKDLYIQSANENPLVSTMAYKYIPPMGINAIVAIAIYGGYNQEDSLIVNKSSVDRGMFDAVHMTFLKEICEQNEIICKPDPTNTSDMKSYSNYEKLVNGIVPIGTYVEDGDCIIGKIAKLSKSDITNPNYIYTDRSLVYKSKEPAYVWNVIHDRNNDEKPFVKVVFKSFRKVEIGNKFCVPDTNEVLTDSGWKQFKDLEMTDKICSLIDDEYIEYVEPIGIYHFAHEGEMISIQNKHLSSTTTLNHKLYVKKNNKENYEPIEAQDAYKMYKLRFKKNGLKMGVDIKTIKLGNSEFDMDAYLQLLGLWIADGSFDTKNVIDIGFTKERKLKFMESFCKKLNLNMRISNQHYRILNKDIADSLRDINKGSGNKYLPKFVFDLNQRQSKVLLFALIEGDGTNSSDRLAYFTTSKQLAEDIGILAFHAGFSATIKCKYSKGSPYIIHEKSGVCNYDQYQVSILRTYNTPIINHSGYDKKYSKIIQYKGIVSCVEVPSHVFYMRENGLTHWTCNSSRAG